MGLRLPSNKFFSKVIYTSLEIWLILLSSIVGFISLFPFLYVILIIRNCFIFRRQMRLIVTGIAFLLFLLTTLHRTKNFPLPLPRATSYRLESLVFSLALLFGLVLLFLQLLVDAILSERQSREQLAKANVQLELANAQLRQYALRIEDIATLQERNRIARDIHDSLGHSLSILNLHLEAALKLWKTEPEEATEFLTEAKDLGSRALDDVRQSVFALRSDPLEGQSLEEAIASLTENFCRSTSIQLNINIDLSHSIPPKVKTAVYRIVQEALTNIQKYAISTQVDIQVKTKNDLQLMISDNGRGFDLTQNTSGFGLQGMCERTQALGGQFEVVTSPGCGCKIIANFPLPLL
jgi:signal transduction histidine kinase